MPWRFPSKRKPDAPAVASQATQETSGRFLARYPWVLSASSSHWSWHVRAEPAGRCLANTGHPLIEGSRPSQVPNYARRVCEWAAQLAQGNPSICAKTS